MISAPVPGVVNALQVTIPGRSPSVPSVKALGNARDEKKEEGEFRHGAGRLTEVWGGQSTIPHHTLHATAHPKRPKRGLEEELEEIVTGVAGTTTWEDGETAPKRFRSVCPPLQ